MCISGMKTFGCVCKFGKTQDFFCYTSIGLRDYMYGVKGCTEPSKYS